MFPKEKYLKLAKGFRGKAKNCVREMIPKVERALHKAYKGRKLRRREYRKENIQTINSAVKEHNISYS